MGKRGFRFLFYRFLLVWRFLVFDFLLFRYFLFFKIYFFVVNIGSEIVEVFVMFVVRDYMG